MKKVLVALAMVLGTGSSVVFAQEVNNSSAVVACLLYTSDAADE